MLSAHFDKKSSGQNLAVMTVADEVNGINPGFKYDFERSRVVLLNFKEGEFRKSFFNILLNGVEIALDEIERDVLDLIGEVLDLFDQLFLLGHHELPFLSFRFLHLFDCGIIIFIKIVYIAPTRGCLIYALSHFRRKVREIFMIFSRLFDGCRIY
jgi:hypothetical protein